MPDLTDYPVIDVAIGLIVMFIMLSIVCSAIQEAIATFTNMRAKFLEKGLREMLDAQTATKVDEALPGDAKKASKIKTGDLTKTRSYVDSRQFSLVLLDALIPETPQESPLSTAAITAEQSPMLKPLVRVLKGTQADIATARAEIEAWFDASMDRVSGWYKRRVQIILLVIALAVAGITNADSFQVAKQLWSDPALRASLVAKSNQILQSGQPPTVAAGNGQTASAAAPVDACPPKSDPQTCVKDKFQAVATGFADVKDLDLPLGWTDANTPDKAKEWPGKVLGLVLTALALSLGAPFWFDVLGKVSRLRAAGAKPAGSDTNTNEPKKKA